MQARMQQVRLNCYTYFFLLSDERNCFEKQLMYEKEEVEQELMQARMQQVMLELGSN